MHQRFSAVFTNDSETGKLFRSLDWNLHPLGPIEKWPYSLKTSLSTLFHSRHPILVMWGPELYQFYNDAAIASIGVHRHPKAMGQPAKECWSELWHLVHAQFDTVLLHGGSTWNEDHLVPIFRNGHMENAYWTYGYSPIFNNDGSIGGLVAVITETTKKVLAANRIGEERERMQKIFKMAPLPMVFLEGPQHAVKFANDSYEKLFFPAHIRPTDYLGKNISDLLPDLKSQGFVESLDQVYNSGKRHFGKEAPFSYTKADHTHGAGYFNYVYEPLYDFTGQIEGILALIIDVTEQVELRQKLERSANDLTIERYKLETIFQDSPTAMALWRGKDLIFEKVNPYCQKCYPGLELLGKSLYDIIPKEVDSFYTRILREVFETGEPRTGKKQMACVIGANGEWEEHYFDYTYLQVKQQDGKPYGVFGHAVDVTERALIQKNLEIAKADAEKANSLKSAFLANMSHEIRTPLGAILGFTDILKNNGLSEKDRAHYLEVIIRNGKALSRIIDDILDLSKIEAGKLEIEKVPICLTELTKDVMSMFADHASTKKVALKFNDSNFPKFPIESDPVRIRQVLVNLIGNALKFTPDGTVTIQGEFIEIENDVIQFKFRIIDTGIGLTATQAKKLFSPFTQADGKSTRRFGGTGLGLALSKKLGQALGGDVCLEAYEQNKGCTFAFTLKTKRSTGSTAAYQNELVASENRAAGRLDGLKVLVIDDAIDNRNLIEIFLNREGAKVDLAADGETGVEMACKNVYDAVLMDIQMPGIDGYEALARLQERHFDKPVIALTAHAFVEEKNRAMDAGFCDHIAKPINPSGLTNSLLSHIRH